MHEIPKKAQKETDAMHPLVDQAMVECIRRTGNAYENVPDRVAVLDKYRLPYDREAENVVLSGCMVLASLPGIIATLARLFDHRGFSYTFLSKEYCCGNYLYRPAIQAKDEQAMETCRALSRQFTAANWDRAKSLGAKRLVIFCSPCYPIYKSALPERDIVFYPQALAEVMGPLSYERSIDYYAGCYRLHRKFASVPMDLQSTEKVFAAMEGLRVNRITAPKCCFKPEGMAHMIDGIRTDLLVHICTGCYGQALENIPKSRQVEVLMLPELVARAVSLDSRRSG